MNPVNNQDNNAKNPLENPVRTSQGQTKNNSRKTKKKKLTNEQIVKRYEDNRKVNRTLVVLWLFVGILLLLFFGGIFAISRGWLGELPPISDLQNPINKSASRIYTSDGQFMGTYSYARENRLMVTYDSLPANLINALVATEDVRFYEHSGIDLRAFGRAVIKRGFQGQKSAGGGSTITQQLAKQLYSEATMDTKKRLMQKPIEWYIATQLERQYTKEEIITMYFNYFDFLHNAVGIKNAANTYFSKEPIDLTLDECATLVGMCKNPSLYNPIRFNERSKERRNVVLAQMQKAGYISQNEMKTAQEKPLDVTHFHRVDHKTGPAPYVREIIRRRMMAKKPDPEDYASWQKQQYSDDSLLWATDPIYGWCAKNTKRNGENYNVYTDGLKIYTSIDSRMQQYAEEAMLEHVGKSLQPKFEAEKSYKSFFPYSNMTADKMAKTKIRLMKQTDRYREMKQNGFSEEQIIKAFNTKCPMTVFSYSGPKDVEMTPMDSIIYYKTFLRAGFMSMDPKTGLVKAYVGGMDFNYFQYDNVMGGGRRQVGSTMKPLLYSLAMENGYTPCDMVPCQRRTYVVAGKRWTPRGGATGGNVTLKWGLSHSNNHVSAWLMSQLNPEQLVNLLHSVGINNQQIHPSLALCLGPCDVGVGEMVTAYTMFSNEGQKADPILVTRIEDAEGNIVYEYMPHIKEVISAGSSYKMVDMMRGVINQGTGKRLRGSYGFKADIAGKTGTTNNNSDGWFIGCVPNLVTGIWVGGDTRDIHFNSTTYGQGAGASLPVWALYMKKVYADKSLGYKQEDKFPIPEDFDFCDDPALSSITNSTVYTRSRVSGNNNVEETLTQEGVIDEIFSNDE